MTCCVSLLCVWFVFPLTVTQEILRGVDNDSEELMLSNAFHYYLRFIPQHQKHNIY